MGKLNIVITLEVTKALSPHTGNGYEAYAVTPCKSQAK